jgi:catechol 2,3-dioxygenase-like lactoylglutathione lyase family enzyme
MALDHVSLGSNNIAAAREFYCAVLAPLGLVLLDESVGEYFDFGAPGKNKQSEIEFSVETPVNGLPATVGNGVHICFRADFCSAVRAFYEAGIQAGGTGDGAPGLRPHYHANYYGAFILDLDGNKIEAVCHVPDDGE